MVVIVPRDTGVAVMWLEKPRSTLTLIRSPNSCVNEASTLWRTSEGRIAAYLELSQGATELPPAGVVVLPMAAEVYGYTYTFPVALVLPVVPVPMMLAGEQLKLAPLKPPRDVKL